MYKYTAIPTAYNGINFRSRLEARWAVFFDLTGLEWEYEPIDLDGWIPDFWVKIPCDHSECSGSHELYVEVKPHMDFGKGFGPFDNHAVKQVEPYITPHPAMFGLNPNHTYFEMAHGAGGGIYQVSSFIHNWETIWKEAGNKVQWKKYIDNGTGNGL